MHGFPFPRRAGSESVELLPDAVLARLPLLPDVPEQAHVMAEKLASLPGPAGPAGPGEPTGEAATGVMTMQSARPRRGIRA